MKRRLIIIVALLLGSCVAANAQRWAVSTNIPDYIALGTMNIRGDVAVHQHWSVEALAKYNPWSFRTHGNPEDQMQNRQMTFAMGPRWWPWNVFAGWFVQGQVQYSQYNRGGIFSPKTTEADAFGAGISAGYTYLLSGHWNLEFGLGFWAGVESYTDFSCPRCGRIEGTGSRFFIWPNDILLSIVYIF